MNMDKPKLATSYKGIEHKALARHEGRLIVRVNVAPDNGVTIAGQHWPQTRKTDPATGSKVYDPNGGELRLIYRSELPAVEARVASADQVRAWEECVRRDENKFKQHVRDKFVGQVVDEDLYRAERRAWGHSPAEQFNDELKTGLPPLRSVEVVEEAPPPETPETFAARTNENLANVIAQAIAAAGKGGKQKTADAT